MVDRNELKQSAELALNLDQVQQLLYETEWPMILLRLRSIEAAFLAQLDTDSGLYLETKRRIAEALVLSALLKQRPLAECKTFFSDLCGLGFSDLALEVEQTILYARLCTRMGYREEAVSTLTGLLARNRNESVPRKQRSLAWAQEVLASIRGV